MELKTTLNETLTTRFEPALYVIVKGHWDAGSSDRFAKELDENVSQAPELLIVIDLEELDFINSMGLGAIVRMWKAAQTKGKKIRIIANKRIAPLFRVSRLDKIIELHVMEESI